MFKKYFLRFFILQFVDIDGTIEVIKLFFMNYFLFIFRNILRNDEKYLICKVNSGLTGWIWWIFKYLPVRLITRIFTSFLLEGHKVNPVSEFNEFEPRLKSAKNRFQLCAGLNFETLNTF